MKKLLLLFLFSSPASATWTKVDSPIVDFSNDGTPIAISICAVDSAVGVVCALITKDANNAPLSLTAGGDLQNKNAIKNALKTELANARTFRLVVKNAEAARATAKSKINLPVTTGDVN